MACAFTERPAGRFLRYRFDTASQLRRHCRLVDSRVLLFFPDSRAALAERSRALIELSFSQSGQQVSLPAVVRSRADEGREGLWLELRALSVLAGLQSAVAEQRRNQRRLALDELAWVEHEGGPVLACPVLDLGMGGARLWGVPGDAPAPGEAVRVWLPNAPALHARIAWARGREVGVRFTPESLDAAAELFAQVEAQWAAAVVAEHAPSCPCTTGGAPLDPPSPAELSRNGGPA